MGLRVTDRRGFTIRPINEEDISAAREVMLRSVREDIGGCYDPVTHADIDQLREQYLDPPSPGPFMLVAVDDDSGEVIGTGGIRDGALKGATVPAELIDRYTDGKTCQLVRVYVLREHRRRGIAHAIVQEALHRVNVEGHYEAVALHTFPPSPGALPFWRAMGAEVLLDDVDGPSEVLYMEIPREALRTHLDRYRRAS